MLGDFGLPLFRHCSMVFFVNSYTFLYFCIKLSINWLAWRVVVPRQSARRSLPGGKEIYYAVKWNRNPLHTIALLHSQLVELVKLYLSLSLWRRMDQKYYLNKTHVSLWAWMFYWSYWIKNILSKNNTKSM